MKGSRDQTLNNQSLADSARGTRSRRVRASGTLWLGWLVRTAVAGQFLTTPTNSH